MTNDFELLKNKEILAILDGDTEFGTQDGIRISMPYLSGPDLCNLSTKFGYHREYQWGSSNPSRWTILDDTIAHCIKRNSLSKLLSFIFSKENFQQSLKDVHISKIDYYYEYICATAISAINKVLYFSGKQFINVNGNFYIKDLEQELNIETPVIETIDRDYIRSLYERASKDIDDGNFDSALTKCRTLIEEVFCYAIEQANETPSDSGDIQKLYNQVKDLYNMHNNKDMDKRINTLLSGLNKIISAIAEMRNENSDSHGVGAKRINIEEHHARLMLNSASTVAEFLLAVVNKKQTQLVTNCNQLKQESVTDCYQLEAKF